MRPYVTFNAPRWGVALVLSLALVQPRVLRAQGGVVVSARIHLPSDPLARPDSGQVTLLLRINGLSQGQRRDLKAGQIAIVSASGMSFTPRAVILSSGAEMRRDLLARYTDKAQDRVEEPQYLFLVPRGATTFELRLPSRDPIPFTASPSLVRR
jgi:hypothetical protein